MQKKKDFFLQLLFYNTLCVTIGDYVGNPKYVWKPYKCRRVDDGLIIIACFKIDGIVSCALFIQAALYYVINAFRREREREKEKVVIFKGSVHQEPPSI